MASSSDAVLAVGVELLGVGLLTILAGASDEAGNTVVVFMLGLWLIYMIVDSSVIEGIGNLFNKTAAISQGE
jgi:hypothetical protein